MWRSQKKKSVSRTPQTNAQTWNFSMANFPQIWKGRWTDWKKNDGNFERILHSQQRGRGVETFPTGMSWERTPIFNANFGAAVPLLPLCLRKFPLEADWSFFLFRNSPTLKFQGINREIWACLFPRMEFGDLQVSLFDYVFLGFFGGWGYCRFSNPPPQPRMRMARGKWRFLSLAKGVESHLGCWRAEPSPRGESNNSCQKFDQSFPCHGRFLLGGWASRIWIRAK